MTNGRFRCKWCGGTGFVAVGIECRSCKGRGWYENPASSRAAIKGTIATAALGSGLCGAGWLLPDYRVAFYGLSAASFGAAIILLAILLRGPEEQSWHGLMLVGTITVILGILAIAVLVVWNIFQ
jgi:hypothetical protein